MYKANIATRFGARCALLAFVVLLSGCGSVMNWVTTLSWLPASGPSRRIVEEMKDTEQRTGIEVVDVNHEVARKLLESQKHSLLSETLGTEVRPGYYIGAGDIVEVSIWEAPPAMLFNSIPVDPRSGPSTTRVTTLPEQMVNSGGSINIPFAGQVEIAGRNNQQIEADIAQRLKDKANQPQVLVRVIRNNTANVTVVGEVNNSTRMPLTPKGERLLDSLAAAGGVRQPVNKMTLQVTRGDQVESLPLDTIIRDPKQNIPLQPGDVVTALFQPLSFSVLGATGKNEEVNFEAQGISLAQALARVGGLQDSRSDARGVFIFRFENANAVKWKSPPAKTPEGKVPVIYRVDLKDPSTFFVAQSFPIQTRDVLYVSNAPAAELQKFLNIIMTAVFPALSVINLAK